MADITPDPIMRIALGFMAAKHLFVASAIGLFERLAGGPATLDELATNCGVPRRTLGISVDAMASLGLVERDGERYHNSAAAAAFLAGTPGPDLRPLLRASGFTAEADLAEQGGAEAALSDRVLDAICLMGPLSRCRQRLAEYHDAGVDLPI